MLAVEEGLVECLHAVEHCLVGVFLGGSQVFGVAKELVGIEQRLVHAAVLAVEEALESLVIDLGNEVSAPVGQLAEHLLGLLAVAIEIGIAQSCQNLMFAIEGHPSPVFLNAREVAGIEFLPRVVDGLSANESVETFSILVVSILTVFHYLQHVVQALFHLGTLALVVTGGIGQCQG